MLDKLLGHWDTVLELQVVRMGQVQEVHMLGRELGQGQEVGDRMVLRRNRGLVQVSLGKAWKAGTGKVVVIRHRGRMSLGVCRLLLRG